MGKNFYLKKQEIQSDAKKSKASILRLIAMMQKGLISLLISKILSHLDEEYLRKQLSQIV